MAQEITEKLTLELFYDMLRIRMIEEAIIDKYPEQKMRCPVHLSIGQEAIAVGVAKNMLTSDNLVSNHRAHAHYLSKGGSLKKMLAEIYGKENGCSSGIGGSQHLIDLDVNIIGTTPIVGGSIPIGVGVAFASSLKKEQAITVIFFGEAATEEGVWAESLNFASLRNLPVLFVCENNFYSVYSPLSVRQPEKRDRMGIAKAHGLYAMKGYGNDVEEVYHITQAAVQYIRENKGPCYLEFETYRYREHCGPNFDPLGYRPQDEVDYWHKRCPVSSYEKILRHNQYLNDALPDQYRRDISLEIKEAFEFSENASFPTVDINEDIYA